MDSPPKRATRRRLAVLALVASIYVYAGHVEPDWLAVTHHVVSLKVPRALRLAHVTDLHTTGIGLRERRLLDALERERPDAIVITGDVLEQNGTLQQARPVLSALHAPLGVFMVPGNWEVAHPLPDMRGFFRDCGVRWMRNESVELVPGVFLVGLDDYALGNPNPVKALAGVPEGATRIALCHAPGFFDETHGEFALALAGHTHGGQVRIPFLPPFYLPGGCGRFVAGWYEHAGSRLYVSRGIGMSGPRFRFLCRPELAILDLVPAP